VTARPTEAEGERGPALSRLALSGNGRTPTRGSMPETVADALREAILDGTLSPGSWLREAEVARELKVSRTPVRDAFRILASEGLVTINANQGVLVAPMTSDDILELYVMREALEVLAARLAARRAPQRCFDEFSVLIPRMKEVGEARDHTALIKLNFQFHAIVRDAAGNRYLERALRQVQNAARRFPDPTLGLPGRIEESIAEHVALANAISQGDEAQAARLAGEHMRHLSELRIRILLQHG
jgi:DNA-binding GntR family transcriptional regulator